MKSLLLTLIRAYRRYLSPLRPPCCRFIPTCSQYALEAVEKYGAVKGGWLALRRVLRCHPFHRQRSVQYDPGAAPILNLWRFQRAIHFNAIFLAAAVFL